MIPEPLLIIGSVIGGVAVVYFLVLKCAQNDWIGNIPPGPCGAPFIGCASVYTSTELLGSYIESAFKQYGWIFQMRCGLQKIVYINRAQELLPALKNNEVRNTTISLLVTGLRKLGLSRFKRREILFIESIWEKHAHTFIREKRRKSSLIQLISRKIEEEDSLITVEAGLLNSVPQKLDRSVVEIKAEDPEDESNEEEFSTKFETLRSICMESPHIWLSMMAYWPRNRINRGIGKDCFQYLKGYLEAEQKRLHIYTEKKFLLLLFLLVLLSSQAATETDKLLGPDVGGWRSFFCKVYAEVNEYHIPKKATIYAK